MEQLSLFECSTQYKSITVKHEVVFQKASKKIEKRLLKKGMDEVIYQGRIIGFVSIEKGVNYPYSYSWQDANLQGGQYGPARSKKEVEQWLNIKIASLLNL